MPKELRLPLVGNFAFDIDAENSKYRLICSLATQFGLEALAPTVFDYRDWRKHYLTMIMQLRNSSRDEAKHLPYEFLTKHLLIRSIALQLNMQWKSRHCDLS